MSNYNNLKSSINNNIYENQTQQITGTVLNAILNEMTNALGAGYQFAGVATVGMTPSEPDARIFYLAGEGIYTSFDGIQVPAGKLGILKWDNRWHLETIDGLGSGGANLTGYVTVASTDDLPDEGVATLGYLCGENLYLYVGEGGDTKEGKYQNCGSFRGPQGDSVQDVEQTQTSIENGGVNKIKFTLSNGISCEFQVRNGTTSSGLFPTLAALQAAYPTPVVGQYAFVGAGFPADIYVCTTAGTWTDSGEDYDGDNVDLTDYATKAEVNQLEAKVDDLDEEISIDLTEAQDDDIEVDTNDDGYVAHIDGDGVHSKDFFVQETKTGARKSITDDLSKLDDVEKGTYYGDEEILITDDNNVVKFGVGADGPFTEGRKPLLPFDKRADGTYKEGASTDQPLASIKESMGLLPMFENWGFIGDSLSSGFINVPNVGGVSPLVDTTETIGRNIYPISWGQIICKMCGSKGANYSVGGATTRSWLSYFGGMTPTNVGYSDGAKGADFSVKRDVYTIMLATNDAGQGNIPVGDISTDVDLQDYHNNADTYAGNYARIISMIKELVPSAKVFCIVPYKAWSINAESGGYNDVVRQLVTMFDKTYLIDLYTYGGNLDTDYLYSSHSTTQGCIYTAYVIANYIDYIIRKNPQDFIFQGCVSRLANDNGNY